MIESVRSLAQFRQWRTRKREIIDKVLAMRLKSLTIENLRVFAGRHTIEFCPESNVFILLGNNGAGKTSILAAIRTLLSEYTNAFPGQGRKVFALDDVHLDESGLRGDHLAAEMIVSMGNGSVDLTIAKYVVGNGSSYKIPKSETKEIYEYGSRLKDRYLQGEDVTFPILAYYSTERGHIKAPERRRDFAKRFENFDAYLGALDAEANFRRFFEWFDLQTSVENEERNRLLQSADSREKFEEAKHFELKTLKAVRQALPKILDGKYSNPRIVMNPMRFVVDETVDDHKREFRIERLSDGYRILIAMVCDLVARMAEANPMRDTDDIFKVPGIVLIDEIELHLHARAQRGIIHKLHDLFPNIQFIVTSHSPLVALSAMDIAQIFTMEEGGRINTDWNEKDYLDYDINQILLSPMFGVESVRAEKWDDILAERKRILMKEGSVTAEEKSRLADLNRRLLLLKVENKNAQPELARILRSLADRVDGDNR